jgi:hypothetical protein
MVDPVHTNPVFVSGGTRVCRLRADHKYNFHLGLLRPEPFWLDTAESTRSVVRQTSL